MRGLIAIAALWLTLGGSGLALEPEERLDDPGLEARARTLSSQLRCVVCQNQSIDESNADMATDLRKLVRQRLVAGDSDAQVKQFLVDRYGPYVLLRPPFDWQTGLLWAAPIAFVLVGGLALTIAVRRRAGMAAAPALNPEERAQLGKLLAEKTLAEKTLAEKTSAKK